MLAEFLITAMVMAMLRLVLMIGPFQKEGLKSNIFVLFCCFTPLICILLVMYLTFNNVVYFSRKAVGDDCNDSDEEAKRSKMVISFFYVFAQKPLITCYSIFINACGNPFVYLRICFNFSFGTNDAFMIKPFPQKDSYLISNIESKLFNFMEKISPLNDCIKIYFLHKVLILSFSVLVLTKNQYLHICMSTTFFQMLPYLAPYKRAIWFMRSFICSFVITKMSPCLHFICYF